MRVILLFLLLPFLPQSSHAQTNAYQRSLQLYKANKLDSAAQFARQAINQYRQTAKNDSLVFAFAQQALIVWDAASAQDALKVMDTALQLVKQLPVKQLAAIAAYSRTAQIYNQQQDFTKAANYIKLGQQSIPLGDTLNKHVVFLYNNTAILYLMQDEYDQARPWAQRAYRLNLQLQGKDGPDMPSILQTIYFISQYSEQYQQALQDGAELQRVMQLHYPPGHRAIGTLHNSLGNIYEALLQYEDAFFHRRKAVDIQLANYLQTKNNGFSLANAYHNLGNLYSYINENFLAQEYLAKGSVLFEQAYGPDEIGMVKIWIGLADNKRKLQAWTESEQLFERAYAAQQKLGPDDFNGLAYVESFYGDLYIDQQQYIKAENLYRRALQHFKQAGASQTRLALQTQKALAEVMSGQGKHDAAIAISRELVAAFRRIYPKGNDGIASKLHDISTLYLAANQPQQALAWSDSTFTELAGAAKKLNNAAWVAKLPFSYNTTQYIQHRMKVLQQLNTASSQPIQAKEILHLADQYSNYIGIHLPAFRTQATLKELAAVHKQLYAIAIETCWQLATKGNKEIMAEKALGYSEQSKAFLLRLASNNLLVDMAAGPSNALAARDHQFRKRIGELNAQYLNEEKANDSVLNLLTASIESYRIFQDSIQASGNTALAAKYRLTPYTVSEIRKKLLTNKETLVEYTVTDQWIFAFVVNGSGCTMQRISREALKDIKTLQKLNALTPETFSTPAYRLYSALVQPVLPFLQQKRLLIIPDGELYYLNFELLISQKGAASFASMPYLIRTCNISYLLSAASAIQFKESYTAQPNQKALLFAPVFTDEMKELYRKKTAAAANLTDQEYLYLHRQPFALEAAQKIGHLIPNDLYQEQQAQEKVFKQSAASYGLLHLGTHAAIDDAAQLQSRLFFAQAAPGDSTNTEDGYLHVYEIYAMQLRAELAVLTACETGAGALQDGEGVQSLSHSFLYAGCKGVVMSLWKIDEKTSMQLITDFYGYLSKGYTKSEALRQAKLNLLEKSGNKMAHPYYWAGLTLIGDDAPVFPKATWPYWLVGALLISLLALFGYRLRRK